jgi:preprotein translocase subunit SecB
MEEQQSKTSKFQFKNYRVIKSHFEIKKDEPSNAINLKFHPKGKVSRKNACFQLELGVFIEDENDSFTIEVIILAEFYFDTEINSDQLDQFFYVNAPALLFPYVRAYISTLTTLSGINAITLPTLNLVALGGELKKNTIETDEC